MAAKPLTSPLAFGYSQLVSFTVYGKPQQKGSKRVFPVKGKGRMDYVVRDANPNARPWASAISAEAAAVMTGRSLVHGPVGVDLDFYFRRPKSHYRTGRYADQLRDSAPAEMITTPDVDKLARCALDALTGIVFRDDSQIAELSVRKHYGEPERVEIVVLAFGEAES